jgi:hypothetical protein
MRLPAEERTLFFDMLAQLAPPQRAVFVARLAAALEAHRDPGPGDIDRILRTAWVGLWTPPAIEEIQRPSRWQRAVPAFERMSKGAA